MIPALDFSRAPFLAIWETTRACDLACSHCRADAVKDRDAGELSTEEGKRLLDGVAAMGTPIFIFSGGDPLQRPDLEELVGHAKGRGFRVGAIPVATDKLDRERMAGLRAAGLDQLALSLDGPDAAGHDSVRGVPGSFVRTLAAAAAARAVGLPLQINTCLSAGNMGRLDALIKLVSSLGVVFWEVFFLVPVGRGRDLPGLAPGQ
ncbi:MAG: radical SAM protein, partial [Elusimicrobiota bacterium]